MPVPLTSTQLFKNNAVSLLAAPISVLSTSLTVMSGHGAMFPQPSGSTSDYFLITLEDQTATRREIIRVTARVGDTFFFDISNRGAENTQIQSWNSSVNDETLVDHRVTAETLERALLLPISAGSAITSSLYDLPFTILSGDRIQLQQNYKPNTVRLFIGGARQKRGVDFTETAPNEITLSFAFSESDVALGQNVVIDIDAE